MSLSWALFFENPEPIHTDYEPRQCHTPKCQLCGRFTKSLHLVWSGGVEPEPDYEVGECCRKPWMRLRP